MGLVTWYSSARLSTRLRGTRPQNRIRRSRTARTSLTGHHSMEWLTDPNAWLGLLTLTALEIVLGIDNIIFISILSSKLPPAEQPKARKLGLTGAFVSRVLLLLSIAWVVKLTTPLFHVFSLPISGRSLILIVGGDRKSVV